MQFTRFFDNSIIDADGIRFYFPSDIKGVGIVVDGIIGKKLFIVSVYNAYLHSRRGGNAILKKEVAVAGNGVGSNGCRQGIRAVGRRSGKPK